MTGGGTGAGTGDYVQVASARAYLRMPVFDRWAFPLLIAAGIGVAAHGWLRAHPEHNPWAPLNLNDPPGWATKRKIAELRGDPAECRAVLDRSGIAYTSLAPAGEGACARPDRTVTELQLRPVRPTTTCAVAASLSLWVEREIKPAARELFGSDLARIDHLGAYSCRRLYGRGSGPWSEHATGNAIDISGFVLADGTRISVLRDWNSDGKKGQFLRLARDGACAAFGTVLSPDYNAAHRDHLHLDQQARRLGGVCR
jgi:hypothetical protein